MSLEAAAAAKTSMWCSLQEYLEFFAMLFTFMLGWAMLRRSYTTPPVASKKKEVVVPLAGLNQTKSTSCTTAPLSSHKVAAKSGLHLLEHYGVFGADAGAWSATPGLA
eukprot:CAMPEP_0178436232 /NCGR_PEP_ID=MMETSP0689_2-20121128/34335_1 /TAXON_ID=160604 /ORGANISM="Amphidinium massartii, Strain CS-259" /LENGTH=107 /DNA_ID=CAMNT_0020058325 /DNA_START=84 /DNA_END=407 /DNA_ORIENTATION=+